MSDKKIELIAQMLAKAESTTPEEAEALTEHAERLMIKYGIEQAKINERRAKAGETTEKIVTKVMRFKGAYRLEFLSLGHNVSYGLGSLRTLQSTWGNNRAWLHIIGFESDVAQAETLINSLQVQAMVAVRAWWKANKADYSWYSPYDQEAARRSFVKGFGSGAGQRIRESRNHEVKEQGTGAELVLVSRDAKVQEYFDTIKVGTSRSRGKVSSEAFSGGREAGKNANTGGRAISQGRGITA